MVLGPHNFLKHITKDLNGKNRASSNESLGSKVKNSHLYVCDFYVDFSISVQNSPEHWIQNSWHEKHMSFHRVSNTQNFYRESTV